MEQENGAVTSSGLQDPAKHLSRNGMVPPSVNSIDHLTEDGAVARETDRSVAVKESLSSSPGAATNTHEGYETHRNIGSIDSGFLELSSLANKDNWNMKPDEILSASHITPPALQASDVKPGLLQFPEDMEARCSSSSAPSSALADPSTQTLQESCFLVNGESLARPKKSELHLNLDVVRRRKATSSHNKSTSSPTFVTPVETPSSILSFVSAGSSPLSCFASNGAFFTPTYAKMRHFAQSPVRQFKPLLVDRNPFMSPLYASDDYLQSLCPVYLVVSFVFYFGFT